LPTDQIGCALRDHQHAGIDVCGHEVRHHGRIGHPQALDAVQKAVQKFDSVQTKDEKRAVQAELARNLYDTNYDKLTPEEQAELRKRAAAAMEAAEMLPAKK
jgi:hypothetical protein